MRNAPAEKTDGNVIVKPRSLETHQAAALCFGGLTALHFLRKVAGLKAGESLLVVGASGAVGSAAVQLGRVMGAEVAAVTSGANGDLVTALGATRVIDYNRTELGADDHTYDVIIDCVGATSYGRIGHLLRPGGRFLRVVAELPGMLAAPLQGRLAGHRVVAGVSSERPEDMRYLAELASRGDYRPLIDSAFPLERIAEAHARVDSHRKRGSVVIDVSSVAG